MIKGKKTGQPPSGKLKMFSSGEILGIISVFLVIIATLNNYFCDSSDVYQLNPI
jgi:hypothetical protein